MFDRELRAWPSSWRAGVVAQVACALLFCQSAHALPTTIPFDGPLIGPFTYGFDIGNLELSGLAAMSPNAMDHWLFAVPESNPYGNSNDDILFYAEVEPALYERCGQSSIPCSPNRTVYDVTWTIELNESHPLVVNAKPGETFDTHLVFPGWERSGFGANAVNVFSDSFRIDDAPANLEVSSWKDSYFFLSIALDGMLPGEAGKRSVRVLYEMLGPEPSEDGKNLVPALQLLGHLTIPEPGTFTLLALGLAGLCAERSRQRR